jgi:hypothetical protein
MLNRGHAKGHYMAEYRSLDRRRISMMALQLGALLGCSSTSAADGGVDAAVDSADDVSVDAGLDVTESGACEPAGAYCASPSKCCSHTCNASPLPDGAISQVCN